MAIGNTACSTFQPLFIASVFDKIPTTSNVLTLWPELLAYGVLTAVSILLTLCMGIVESMTVYRASHRIRCTLFPTVIAMPYIEVAKKQPGEFVNIVISSSAGFASWPATALRSIYVTGMMGIVVPTILVFLLSWKMSCIIFLGALPLSAVIVRVAGHFVTKLSAKNIALTSRLWMQSVTIHLFYGSAYMDGYRSYTEPFFKTARMIKRTSAALSATTATQQGILLAQSESLALILLFFGTYLTAQGDLSLGLLLAFFLYASRVLGAANSLAGSYLGFKSFCAVGDSILPYSTQRDDAEANKRNVLSERSAGVVSFRNVSFSWSPTQPVLEDVSFVVPSCQLTLLSGKSGTGKSTILHLILGLYPASAGEVTIDGMDVETISRRSLTASALMIEQSPALWNGTIEENLKYGLQQHIPPDIVEQALIKACAWSWISHLPHGLSTPVGRGGSLLSGGQRKMIVIANALLLERKILLCDEITSDLDPPRAASIMALMRGLAERTTILFISHQTELAAIADHAMILEGGKVTTFAKAAERSLFLNTTRQKPMSSQRR